MKLLLTTLAIVYLSLFMSLQAQEQVRVIPYPAEVTMQAETCKLKSGQKIHYLDASLYKEAAFLEKKLADLNYKMKVIPGKKAAKGINLSLDNRLQNKEGYQLIIAPQTGPNQRRKSSWSFLWYSNAITAVNQRRSKMWNDRRRPAL